MATEGQNQFRNNYFTSMFENEGFWNYNMENMGNMGSIGQMGGMANMGSMGNIGNMGSIGDMGNIGPEGYFMHPFICYPQYQSIMPIY